MGYPALGSPFDSPLNAFSRPCTRNVPASEIRSPRTL